jgi:hypothetical protein
VSAEDYIQSVSIAGVGATGIVAAATRALWPLAVVLATLVILFAICLVEAVKTRGRKTR